MLSVRLRCLFFDKTIKIIIFFLLIRDSFGEATQRMFNMFVQGINHVLLTDLTVIVVNTVDYKNACNWECLKMVRFK